MMKKRTAEIGMSLMLAAALAGCKAKPAAVSDEQLTASIQSQLAADSALAGQQVTVSVQNGVASLNGVAANNAQKTIAARDAAGIPGVKEVVNQIAIGPVSTTATTAPPSREPLQSAAPVTSAESRRDRERLREAAPIERTSPPVQQPTQNATQTPVAAQPSAPAPPVFRDVTLPAGKDIPVRVTQTLDSSTTRQGDSFSGVVTSDVLVDGMVAIPAGAPVSGSVVEAHDATHFKGSSSLVISLNSVSRHGESVALATDPYEVRGKGRGVNTAEKAGGGAAVGAILGGIFGGGKGAAIGAATGGGIGAGSNAVTRGQQVQIPSETVVRFHLTSPVSVRVREDGGHRHHDGDNSDSGLQHHPGV